MYWDTDHKEKVSHQNVFFCVPLDDHHDKMSWDTDHKEKVFYQYLLFCAPLEYHLLKMIWYTDHKEKVSHQMGTRERNDPALHNI